MDMDNVKLLKQEIDGYITDIANLSGAINNTLAKEYLSLKTEKLRRAIDRLYGIATKEVDKKLQVNIGDTVSGILESRSLSETVTFKLVPELSDYYGSEVNLFSPLGQEIFHKQVGEMCTYKVNGIEYKFTIIDIKPSLQEEITLK